MQRRLDASVAPVSDEHCHNPSLPFHIGLKLEAKDHQFPALICVATIKGVRDNEVLIHFDNWDDDYDYWCEATCTDIHPVGWCRRCNHDLQPPKSMYVTAIATHAPIILKYIASYVVASCSD